MTNNKTPLTREWLDKRLFIEYLNDYANKPTMNNHDRILKFVQSYAEQAKKEAKIEVLEEFRSRKGKLIEVPHVDGGIAEIYAYPTIDKWVEEKLNQLSK